MNSSSRDGTRVRVLAVHTTEGIMRAVDLRDWDAWAGSSHASADETGVLLDGAEDGFVDHDRASWTLRSGNPWSENIELCGFAGWSRAEWLSRPKLLDACARWLAERSVARGIPLVKLTPAQYRAGATGVIGHHDHTVGYQDGTHWDPGPDFPWTEVLTMARAYAKGQTPDGGFLMALTDAEQKRLLARVDYLWETLTPGKAGYKHHGVAYTQLANVAAGLTWLRNAVAQLASKADIDPAQLAVAVADELADDLDVDLSVRPKV